MLKEFTPTERRFLDEVGKHRDALVQDVEDARLIILIDSKRPPIMMNDQNLNLELALHHINAAYDALEATIKGLTNDQTII
jgi:hypothetical protein